MSITDTERTAGNGQAPADPGRIRFGDKPHQSIPDEWAEPFIRYVFRYHRQVWNKVIPAIMDDNAGRDG